MTRHQEVYNEDCALYVPCSQVQLARVVVRVLVLVDVVCVMLVVLIAHVDVVHAVDTVFVAIFCSGRCTLYMLRMTKKMDYFLRNLTIGERIFPGSMSIDFLLPMETSLGEEPAGSLLCGFAFAFDRHAKSFTFSCNACSSG